MTQLWGVRRVASSRPSVRPTTVALTGFAALVVLLTVLVGLLQPATYHRLPWMTGPAWLDGWIQYDSGWYHTIATQGYSYTPGQQSSIAFFPTYPMAVRAVGAVLGDVQLAGVLLTVVAGAGAVVLFTLWTSTRLSRGATLTAVALLLLYPYAFFLYGTMYADAVFLCTVLASFVLLERGHPWLAGLVGILATAGRPVGIAVAVGLAVRALEIRASRTRSGAGADTREDRLPLAALVGAVRELRLRDLGVLLSVLGIVGWCLYLWVSFGNPLAFVAAEASPGWDQGTGPRTWFKIALLGTMLNGPVDLVPVLLVQAAMCLAAVLLLRRVWQRFGWGYLSYSLVVVGIPILGSKDFMGSGRYLLAAFPLFAAAGELLATTKRRWVRPVVLSVFAVGLVTGTVLYAQGYEVS